GTEATGEATEEALALATKDPTPAEETKSDPAKALNSPVKNSTEQKDDGHQSEGDLAAQKRGQQQPDNKVVPMVFRAEGSATTLNPPSLVQTQQTKPATASPASPVK